MRDVKIKVCGMKEYSNIQALHQLDIDYMGLIFYKESKRFFNQVSALDLPTSDRIQRVGVFVNGDFQDIKQKIAEFQLAAIQLHGNESPNLCRQIKELGIVVIKAFGIDATFDWSILESYVHVVNYFLFDTKSDLHGGTGRAFDWSILEKYNLRVPYFLSGGIGPDNIEQALATNDPRLYGIDLNSKFESAPGLKNIELLKKVVKTI